MTANNASLYRPKPKPSESQPEGDRDTLAGLLAVGGIAIALLYTGICGLVLAGTQPAIGAFVVFWVMFASAIFVCVATSGIMAKLMDLGPRPGLIIVAWWGANLTGLVVVCFLLDYFASSESIRLGKSLGFLVFILSIIWSSLLKLTAASPGKAVINGILLYIQAGIALLISLVPGIIIGLMFVPNVKAAPKEAPWLPPDKYAHYYRLKQSVGNKAPWFPAVYKAQAAQFDKEMLEVKASYEEPQQQAGSSYNFSNPYQPPTKTPEQLAAEARQNYLNSLTSTQRSFVLLSEQKDEHAHFTMLSSLIANNARQPSLEFQGEFNTLLAKAKNKQEILDLCIRNNADTLTAAVFKSLIANATPGPETDKLVRDCLFLPGSSTAALIAASYEVSPTVTVEKFKTITNNEGIIRDVLAGISANDASSPVLTKFALQAFDDAQRQKLYALTLKPGLSLQTTKSLASHWRDYSPDTLSPSVRVYLDIITSNDPRTLEDQTLKDILAIQKPDRRVEKPLVALLLESCRQDPQRQKLDTLIRWQSEETNRLLSDSLMSIKSQSDVSNKATDLRLAIQLEVQDATDHLTEYARKSNTYSDELLDYLRADTRRVEQLLLGSLEKSGYRLPESENDIRLLEEVGWKPAKQKFVELYKSAKSVSDRKRFEEAEARVTRRIAQTLRNYPDNNPDKGKFKPNSAVVASSATSSTSSEPSLFTTDDKIGPKPLNPPDAKPTRAPVKAIPGDIVLISSRDETEYATINKVEPELITVTLLNRSDKTDFINAERILKVIGKVEDENLIALIKKGAKPGQGSSSTTAAASAAGPAPAPAAAPAAPETPKTSTPKRPEAGMKVEAKKFGEWHEAKIEKVVGDQCYVTFDGKGAGWDGTLGLAEIRPVGSKKNFMMLSFE